MTLEAIGDNYGITRERVRQIEVNALNHMKKSRHFKDARPVFDEMKGLIDSFGYVVPEDEVLNYISRTPSTQNHILLLLYMSDNFIHGKESSEFRKSWSSSQELDRQIIDTLRKLYQLLSNDKLFQEDELVDLFLKKMRLQNNKGVDHQTVLRWISLSKRIGRNPLGEWGLSDSSNVRTKGVRDYAYLVIRHNGSPMHFSEVADAIESIFNRPAHSATCHNELIKDDRFVLVGRGLYALVEWGYGMGVVRDVIRDTLKEQGPLSRDEILKKVRKERYVKDNTILVNLHNSKYFARLSDGRYTLA